MLHINGFPLDMTIFWWIRVPLRKEFGENIEIYSVYVSSKMISIEIKSKKELIWNNKVKLNKV